MLLIKICNERHVVAGRVEKFQMMHKKFFRTSYTETRYRKKYFDLAHGNKLNTLRPTAGILAGLLQMNTWASIQAHVSARNPFDTAYPYPSDDGAQS